MTSNPISPISPDVATYNIHLIIYLNNFRIHAELCQLREGLRSFNFLDCLIEYKSGLESLLSNQPVNMTFEEAKKLVQVVYSEEGGNSKQEELNTVYAFDVFLQDCIESTMEVTFADLLSFWTGASAVPPLGFEKKLEIHFVNGKDRLPVAHICEMSLELPRGLNPEELQEKLLKAIQWGGEFHLC